MGIVISQELHIEGNLNVTGTIESVTIDSLNQVILDLQNQIAGMQSETRLETRIFTTNSIALPQTNELIPFDIQSLIGVEIEQAFISVLDADIDADGYVLIYLANSMTGPYEILIESWNQQSIPFSIKNVAPIVYNKEVFDVYGNYIHIWNQSVLASNVTLTLAITAQFPN